MKSSKPSKQRKFLFTAPLHVKRKFLSSHLSKELRQKYKTRSMPLKKGDEVEIMKGEYKKKKGKITKVNLKKFKAYVEGVITKKTTGTDVQVGLHPSNLKIINLNLDDKKRVKSLDRKMKK